MQLEEKSGFIEDPELLCVTFYPWSTWYTQALFLYTLLIFLLAPISRLNNIAEKHRYSRRLADFQECRSYYYFM